MPMFIVMSGNQACNARGIIMDYFKHRSAAWWFQIVLNAIGIAAGLFLLVILYAIYEL